MSSRIDLDDYAYALPPGLVAQRPAPRRGDARLLVLERDSGELTHASVRELARWLGPGDLLVLNATRVVPARLRGRKASGGAAEALLLGAAPGVPGRYRALVRARGRLRVGQKFAFGRGTASLDAELLAHAEDGEVVLAFDPDASPYALGETPLPPYIRREAPDPADAARYQTAYARVDGSVAAPTAGLHLSAHLLRRLERRGVERAEVVLHIGPGTFRPLRERELRTGRLHPEAFALPEAAAAAVARTRARGGRVVAVGTTTVRVLETRASGDGCVRAGGGQTQLFLKPGDAFRATDALLTNFHLPRSSLLLLAAAFGGRERLLRAYAEAIRAGYRFYSYGDAMLIL